MAKITRKTSAQLQHGGAAPYGNVTALYYQVATNASGAVLESDSSAAVASGDVIDLGPIPAGIRLDDVLITVSTAMSASVTGKLGFAYADGVDSTEVPQDADYFFAGADLAAAARLRTTTANAVVRLPKAAYLTLTVKGAAIAQVGKADVVIGGEWQGAA